VSHRHGETGPFLLAFQNHENAMLNAHPMRCVCVFHIRLEHGALTMPTGARGGRIKWCTSIQFCLDGGAEPTPACLDTQATAMVPPALLHFGEMKVSQVATKACALEAQHRPQCLHHGLSKRACALARLLQLMLTSPLSCFLRSSSPVFRKMHRSKTTSENVSNSHASIPRIFPASCCRFEHTYQFHREKRAKMPCWYVFSQEPPLCTQRIFQYVNNLQVWCLVLKNLTQHDNTTPP
jgi:hypothetical protein